MTAAKALKAITYEEMVKAIASFLDSHSGVDPKRILNAASIRGADLSEMISSSKAYSPMAKTAFMLFELVENREEDYITKGEKTTSMSTIQTFDLHLMIYGNASPSAAQQVSAAFKREENAMALRDLGIFVNGVVPVEAVNEFINNTWLLRRDVVIRLQARFEFDDPASDPGVFDDAQTIQAIVVEA